MSDEIKKTLSKTRLWSYIREQRIVYNHKKTAEYCKELIKEYFSSDQVIPVHALKDLPSDKIIWQYWGQGFENLPVKLKQCIDSVDKWKGDYSVIRLDDSSIEYYLDLPQYIQEAKKYMSRTHFSDLLRVCLLSLYGGIWMDASIYMSGPVPKYVFENDFFVYQRDPAEPNKDYWKNTYAYYFSWAKGFHVNMLSSFFFARKNSVLINAICWITLYHWSISKTIPDYFFLQILFDILINNRMKDVPEIKNCRVMSDCKPHFFQQYINDPAFTLATKEEILNSIPIHKLTYK